ncbi:MAG: hypothetical protein IKJ19_06900 [Clostridia bacterium]|nr:hypothetical protein [Clostridia bacterium]
MESLFELKNPIAVDLSVFEQMKQKALELLSKAKCEQYTQAIVLYSTKNNEYGAVINNALDKERVDENLLLKKLKDVNDTQIAYLLCLWQDKNVDICSYAFRKDLLLLNEKNSDTLIFVTTQDGISAIKLSVTVK